MVETTEEQDKQTTQQSPRDAQAINASVDGGEAEQAGVEGHPKNQGEIRVLFLGDHGVGKSSIIHYIVTDMFPKNVRKMFTTALDADLFLLETDIKTVLVDSSTSGDQGDQKTNAEIEKASVIILVYDVNNFDTIKRLRTAWMPRIVKLNEKVPVILCGNKVDQRNSNSEGELESLLTPLCQEFRQAEMIMECSAKGYLGLSDIIYCAQNAVLYPIAPLHDSCSKMLRPEFEKALLRIFRIMDADNDGYLSDEELTNFQLKVFNQNLKKNYITAFKELLVLECDDYDTHEAEKGITIEAFKTFQKILIKKLKMEVCWTILRYFGYDNDLRIVQSLWNNDSIPQDVLERARAFELKKDCLTFLTTLFRSNTPSRSRTIDLSAIDKIFATTEQGVCPWDILKETVYESRSGNFGADPGEQQADVTFSNSGGISLENWVGMWNKYFQKDTKTAFRDLVYIGFCGQLKDAIQPIMARPRDIFGVPTSRKTFNCLLVGASSSGKSTFMDAFIQATNTSEERKEARQGGSSAVDNVQSQLLGNNEGLAAARFVVKSIKERDPKNKDKYTIKYLTIAEVPEDLITSGALFDPASPDHLRLNRCDAIIYIFESNDAEQVDFIKTAKEKFREVDALKFVPQILLQSKMDLQMPESGENRSMLGQTLSNELQLKVYKEVSAIGSANELTEVIDAVLETCNEPQRALTDSEIAAAKEEDTSSGLLEFFKERPAMSSAIAAVLAVGLGILAFTLKNKK